MSDGTTTTQPPLCLCAVGQGPFHCPRWNRTMGPELQQICAGQRDRDKRGLYVRVWEEELNGLTAAGLHPDDRRWIVGRFAGGRIELEVADRLSRDFGLTVWAAGERLAEWILATPGAVAGRVLDLGTGTGVVGIAAGLSGAERVDLADASAECADRAADNARRNGIEAEPFPIDWRTDSIHRVYDTIVAADILYHPSANGSLFPWIAARLAPGGRCLLADPGRVPRATVVGLAADAGFAVDVVDLGDGVLLYDLRRMPPLVAPDATPHRTTLTIGMAVCDDYDGWYFTLQNILVNHAEVLDRLEFITVDQRPDGPEGTEIRRKIRGVDQHGAIRATDGTGWIPRAKYFAMPEPAGTSAPRARIFAESTTDAVLVLDCHVLIQKGALAALLDWFDRNPDSRDLIHGPMLDDNPQLIHATHMFPEWGSDLMFGTWRMDRTFAEPGEPREIPMHGLGLFACRRDAWPGFPPHLKGFGGEEGNIHEAIRQGGGRVLCHPGVRWLHRFDRPRFAGRPPYPCHLEDKFWNYLIWARWLGKPTADIVERFQPRLGRENTAAILAELARRDVPRYVPPSRRTVDAPDPPPCVHRGDRLYQRKCPACKSRSGRVEWVDVFSCHTKRRCTIEQSGLTIQGCNTCEARETPAAERVNAPTFAYPTGTTSTRSREQQSPLSSDARQPLVSVLIVTHGRFQLLRRALACFLTQDHAPRELLILNHHPRPLTRAFADPPGTTIRIFNEPNERVFGDNLNRLLPEARGEFLSTWGDDDLYLPWFLSTAIGRIGDRDAWKPEQSWHYHGLTRKIDRVGNTLEASIVWRTEYVRRHGFAGGDTEAETLLAGLGGPVPADNLKHWTPFLTTWATGHHHLSGGIGRGTAAERHAIWRAHNQDDGGGELLTPSDVSDWWARLEPQIPDPDRNEWMRKVALS